MQEALNHPYLHELHSRAREPLCDTPFDWAFERDYPDEMPQALLQRHMFNEMLSFRAGLPPLAHMGSPLVASFAGMGSATDVPVAAATGASVMPGAATGTGGTGMDADAAAATI